MIAPDHPRDVAMGIGESGQFGRIEAGADACKTANGATAVLVSRDALIALLVGRAASVMADRGCPQWIGGGDGSRPACRDRCKNLHDQRDHDDREKLL